MRNESHADENANAMNNHTYRQSGLQLGARPTRACAAYEEILPVLDEPAVDQRQAERAREHLATCAYCQAQHAHYVRFDMLMRSAYAPDDIPLLRIEDVIGQTSAHQGWNMTEPERSLPLTAQPVTRLLEAEADEETSPHPQASAAARPPQRRWMSALATAAAILVIGAIVLTLIVQARLRPTVTSPTSPTRPPFNSFQMIGSVSMLSASDGWSIEYESPIIIGHTLDPRYINITLLRYRQGRWTPTQRFQTPVAQIACFLPDNQSVSMDSPTDGWATLPASSIPISGATSVLHDEMLHYTGRIWREVALPTGYQMCGVKMLSPMVGWAFGYGPGGEAIMAYNGHSWHVQPIGSSPLAARQINSGPYTVIALSAVSPTDAWALAQPESGGPAVNVILRYHAGGWEQQSVFPAAILTGLSFDTPDDGWALGIQSVQTSSGATTDRAIFVHYHAGTWTVIPHAETPQVLQTQQIEMVSPTDGWALGNSIVVGGNLDEVLLHYDGQQWHDIIQPQIAGRASLGFSTLSVTGADDVWVGGEATWPADEAYPTYPYVGGGSNSSPQSPVTPLLLRYHNGGWQTLVS